MLKPFRCATIGMSMLTVLFIVNVQPAFSQTDEQVDAARLKAIDYIRKQQQADGPGEYT